MKLDNRLVFRMKFAKIVEQDIGVANSSVECFTDNEVVHGSTPWLPTQEIYYYFAVTVIVALPVFPSLSVAIAVSV